MGKGPGMSSAKPRDRKCGTCRFYESSPLWRRGWCRNPLLYDPSTNHLVEANSLACSRTFIDYWEPRASGQRAPNPTTGTERLVRRAPSIPLTATGPGGRPLSGTTAATAAAQPVGAPRERPPQLSLVKPEPQLEEPAPPPASAPAAPGEPALTTPLSPPVADTPAEHSAPTVALPAPIVAGVPEPALPADRRRRLRTFLLVADIVAVAVLVLVLSRMHTPTPAVVDLPTPTAVSLGIGLVPTDTVVPPTATPLPRTTVPTPAKPVMAPGGKATLTGLGSSGLRVHKDAGLNSTVVGVMRGNVTVQIVAGPKDADGITWWQVKGWDSKGTLGWASGKYLAPTR